MKTSSEKAAVTSSPTATQTTNQPFFAKASQASFFKPSPSTRKNSAAKSVQGRALAPPPNQVTSLKSTLFSPAPLVAQHIEDGQRAGARIRASFGSFASGEITVRKNADYYETQRVEQLPLTVPLLRPLQEAGIPLVLAVQINKSQIEGYVSVAQQGRPAKNGFLQAIQANTWALGWRGVQFSKLPGATKNAISGGVLEFSQENLPVRLGGFLDSKFSLGLTDDRLHFAGSGTAKIPGLQPTAFSLALRPDGKLAGSVSTTVTFKNFSGAVQLRFLDGLVEGQGDVQYTTEKLSGTFHLLLTDEKTARGIAFGVIPPEQLNQAAINQSGLQPSGETTEPKPGPRALAGTANVTFFFNEWLTGTALVVVDGAGHVTVMSEITPQKEVTLFKPRNFPEAGPKSLFRLNPTFRYGVPYVADIHVGISVNLTAGATLGPALLRNITVQGTYSTDPLIFNQFALSADLYMQAQAELALALEAKAGLSILFHDIEVGAGIKGALVLKAYVEGTPTIGYREKADPIQGKKGEFYIKGSAVAVAQPFFVLSGYLFVDLDSPRLSPAPDKRWTWCLGKKEYPLGAGWGIGMEVGGKDGYVLGSGQAPEVQFNAAQFDASKFVDNVVDDQIGKEQARKQDSKNVFNDKLKGQAPAPPPPAAPAISISGGSKKGGRQKAPTDAKLTEKWMNAVQKGLMPLEEKAQKKPLDQATLARELNKLRSRFGFTAIQATASGDNWIVVAEMFDRSNRRNPLVLKGAPKTDGKQEDKAVKAEAGLAADGLTEQVRAGLAALEQVTLGYAKQGATEDEMKTAINSVRRKFSFKSIQVQAKDGYWHYLYEINPKGDLTGPKVLRSVSLPVGSWIKNLQTQSYERILSHGNVLKRSAAGGTEQLTFQAATVEGGTNVHTYASEGTQWERSNFTHASQYVMPKSGSSGADFVLKHDYQDGSVIRATFYSDSSSSRSAIVVRKLALPELQYPSDPAKFLSEAPVSLEASKGYTQTLNGKAVVPVNDASPDHDPPIARHWSLLGGNNAKQTSRENWNRNLTSFKLMSWAANQSLGSRGATYTEQVGVNFKGPGE